MHEAAVHPASALRAGVDRSQTAFILAAGSAAAYAAGFPPFGWTAAPWLALAPLLIASAALPPGRAALLGLGWATAVGAAVAWYLPGMLAGYFGLPTPLAWLGALVVIGGLHGGFVAAFTAWVAWLAQRRAASPLLLAAGWTAVEYARAASGLGSPWALAAYSQVGWTTLIQVADLGGPFAVGLLLAGVNACAAATLAPALRGPRPWRAAAAVGAALLGALLYGDWRLGQDFAAGPGLPVAVVQAGAGSPDPDQRAARLQRTLALTRAAGAAGGLVVWPEHAVDAYLEEPSPTRASVLRAAAELDGQLILGGPSFAPSPAGGRYHNSAYLLRGGAIVARYDKQRLVPFAEDGRLRAWLGGGDTTYTAGDGPAVLPASIPAGVLLCVEAMFGDLARRAVDDGAALLVNLSNDAWFGHPDAARHQLQIAALRAVETRRWLVRAAATGYSAVVDAHGRTLAESRFGAHEVLRAMVHPARAVSPYQRLGDAVAWLAVAATLVAALRRNRGGALPRPTRARRIHSHLPRRFPCVPPPYSPSPRSA